MIWDHDRYVKASPGSTLHIPNNGLTILTIWEEKVEYSELLSKSASKSGFDTFLKNIENPCLDPKYRSEIICDRKSTPETYFQATCMKGESQLVKKVLCIFY